MSCFIRIFFDARARARARYTFLSNSISDEFKWQTKATILNFNFLINFFISHYFQVLLRYTYYSAMLCVQQFSLDRF